MKIVAGRSFNESDHHCNAQLLHTLLINESAAKLFGFHSPEEAVGKKVTAFNREWDIVGVTADFHQKSVKQRIEPTLLIPAETFNSSFSIKVTPGQVQQVIAGVHAKFDYFFPGDLFEYYFLDEKFNEQYRYDRMFGKVFGFFAGLAIFIACLGLFGLSLYTISQRTKEIGVRKVLGASVQHIVVLLSKDFIRLVLIAGLIAFPVAGVVMKNWLDDFAYRTELSWWIFVAAGVLAACIAWATVAVHAVRSALAKPVDVLRNE
jgi:ABC-type transport system, involved in lipoprotein release, permease component